MEEEDRKKGGDLFTAIGVAGGEEDGDRKTAALGVTFWINNSDQRIVIHWSEVYDCSAVF